MKKNIQLLVILLSILLLASCATNSATNSATMQPSLMDKINEAADYINEKTNNFKPEIGLILGSGLGDLAEEIENPIIIDYKDIPHFPVSTAPSHKGRLVIGELEGKKVICMQGRFHYYKGYEMYQIAFPVQVMKILGVEKLIITNAAGCVNRNWNTGSLMLITDHINLTALNPLRGSNISHLGERFFDMTRIYDKDLQALVLRAAKNVGVDLKQGVYMYFSGPNFETPAEIRASEILGADAVGMSTVPEVIAASHCGMKVIGISCMTNMAAGILDQPITSEEVTETAFRVRNEFQSLIKEIIRQIP